MAWLIHAPQCLWSRPVASYTWWQVTPQGAQGAAKARDMSVDKVDSAKPWSGSLRLPWHRLHIKLKKKLYECVVDR